MLEEKKNGETYLRWTQVIGDQAAWMEMSGTRNTCPWQDSNVGCENYWDCGNSQKDISYVNRLKDYPLGGSLDHMAERHVYFWSIWYKSSYEWACYSTMESTI